MALHDLESSLMMCRGAAAEMSEQDTSWEDDPSTEWIYNKETDMWISLRQQIAIEGSTYRRMVNVKAADAPAVESGATPSEESGPARDEQGEA
jgi:hypothetical protein